MYKNIGEKIKCLAIAQFIIMSILTLFLGLYISRELDEPENLFGIAICIFGSLLSWISSWLLYGFGQLVENSDYMARGEIKEDNSRSSYGGDNEDNIVSILLKKQELKKDSNHTEENE